MYKEYRVSLAGNDYVLMETESGAGWRNANASRYIEGTTYGNWGGVVPFKIDRAEKFSSLKAAIEDLQDHVSWYHGVRRHISRETIEAALMAKDTEVLEAFENVVK